MTKLTVAIVTHNEEKKIADCLKSLKFADEVVVVDGKSEDKTAEIAKSLGAKVYVVANELLMKKNMNLAFEKATNEWILSLDADERVSPQLAVEIKQTVENPGDFVAFQIPRRNLFFNKYLNHTGWYPDYQDRLFKKGKAKFPAKNVHEELAVDGLLGKLTNPIDHLHYESLSQWLSKLDSYTSFEAKKLIADGKKVVWQDCIRFPIGEFFRRFFVWEGYKDGLHGLTLSILMAFYWEIIFAKLWEHEGFWEHDLSGLTTEVKQIHSDWQHYQITLEKNPAKKLGLKIKRKITL